MVQLEGHHDAQRLKLNCVTVERDGRLVALGCLVCVSVVLLVLTSNLPVNISDEGTTLWGAAKVLGGGRPYKTKDFWTIYAHGQFYVLAALSKIFAPSIFVERMPSGLLDTRCSRRWR